MRMSAQHTQHGGIVLNFTEHMYDTFTHNGTYQQCDRMKCLVCSLHQLHYNTVQYKAAPQVGPQSIYI